MINKIDSASDVGTNLDVMEPDIKRMRGDRPPVVINPENGARLDRFAAVIAADGFSAATPQRSSTE